jgi:hypothetical protein
MFANIDCYINNYEKIFQKSAAGNDPFFFDGPTGKNIELLNFILGNFILQKLTNTYTQKALVSHINLGFDGSINNFQFIYERFNFGMSCSVTNIILELSTFSTSGNDVNNRINLATTCNGTSITIIIITFSSEVFSIIWATSPNLNTNMFIIVYVTIAYTSQDFLIDQLDWTLYSTSSPAITPHGPSQF